VHTLAAVTPSWKVGDATISVVTETELVYSCETFLRQPLSALDEYRAWLTPYLTEDGRFRMVVQALLVAVDGLRIVVDTCIGNGKDFGPAMADFNGLDTAFPASLVAADFDPDSVDYVICTHLHVDHVGWNTQLIDGVWVPTFPKARYLMTQLDLDHWRTIDARHNPFRVSVQPVIDAGLVDAVDPDHRVSHSVSLMPTPGHTPGHASVRIDNGGDTAVITGDMVHSPVQFARPDWSSVADTDRDAAQRSRERLVALAGDQPMLVIGTHFPPPTAGHIVRDGASWRFE
jgi:glyoxylase-like metal-dependent hydrolase (beta-lactamase superfamily II)